MIHSLNKVGDGVGGQNRPSPQDAHNLVKYLYISLILSSIVSPSYWFDLFGHFSTLFLDIFNSLTLERSKRSSLSQADTPLSCLSSTQTATCQVQSSGARVLALLAVFAAVTSPSHDHRHYGDPWRAWWKIALVKNAPKFGHKLPWQ